MNSQSIKPPILTKEQKQAGSLKGLIPVRINENTIVYVKPGTDINKIKKKYNKL